MSRSKRIRPAPVLKNVIVLKIGPEPSVNERSIETPKTTPKLDSTTAKLHITCGDPENFLFGWAWGGLMVPQNLP